MERSCNLRLRSPNVRLTQYNAWFGVDTRTCIYDDEDRLLQAGDTTDDDDDDEFLTAKHTSNATVRYRYSFRGETQEVDLGNGTIVAYRHDVLGRPVARLVNGEVTEKHLWLGRTRLLAIFDKQGNVLQRFLYADGRMPLAMEQAGQRYTLAYDQVGSLRAVLDTSGQLRKAIQYDAFGVILHDSDPNFLIPFGFAGGLHDRDTGLVRFGYRDYDPEVGRWTSKDPIGFEGESANLYDFLFSSPLLLIDPFGTSAMEVAGPIAAGVAMADTPVPGQAESVATIIVAIAFIYDLQDAYESKKCTLFAVDASKGFWDGPAGAEEWGKRSGVGRDKLRKQFHDLKQDDKVKTRGGNEKLYTSLFTRDVCDVDGEIIGNLEDVR